MPKRKRFLYKLVVFTFCYKRLAFVALLNGFATGPKMFARNSVRKGVCRISIGKRLAEKPRCRKFTEYSLLLLKVG